MCVKMYVMLFKILKSVFKMDYQIDPKNPYIAGVINSAPILSLGKQTTLKSLSAHQVTSHQLFTSASSSHISLLLALKVGLYSPMNAHSKPEDKILKRSDTEWSSIASSTFSINLLFHISRIPPEAPVELTNNNQQTSYPTYSNLVSCRHISSAFHCLSKFFTLDLFEMSFRPLHSMKVALNS